jgi:ABC-type amino acid transport substrate-binding protein
MPRGRRKLFVTFTILAVIAAALLLLLYSGMSKRNVFRTPEIKIKANNNYRETVKVVCDYDYDPYSFFDKNKRPIGFDIEFINYLANKMHVNLDLHMTDWVSAQKELNVRKSRHYSRSRLHARRKLHAFAAYT